MNVSEQIFTAVDQMPEMIGGLSSLHKQIIYPEIARIRGIEGRVYVSFIVNEKGEVENPEIVRGLGYGCDKVALEAIQRVKFKPGVQKGKPVKVRYSVPIVFKLK